MHISSLVSSSYPLPASAVPRVPRPSSLVARPRRYNKFLIVSMSLSSRIICNGAHSASFFVHSVARRRIGRPCWKAFSSSSNAGGEAPLGVAECARSLQMLGKERNAREILEVASRLSLSARTEIANAIGKASASKHAPCASEAADAVSSAEPVAEPSRRDLWLVAVNQAIPFVGFGFMDNALLILAGDAIDNSFGVTLGISTMCAAALGNIVSDVAGVGLGTVIEDICSRLGIPQPNLSQAQRQLRSVRFSGQLGCAVGITVGCVIGMFPLLFLDSGKGETAKNESRALQSMA